VLDGRSRTEESDHTPHEETNDPETLHRLPPFCCPEQGKSEADRHHKWRDDHQYDVKPNWNQSCLHLSVQNMELSCTLRDSSTGC